MKTYGKILLMSCCVAALALTAVWAARSEANPPHNATWKALGSRDYNYRSYGNYYVAPAQAEQRSFSAEPGSAPVPHGDCHATAPAPAPAPEVAQAPQAQRSFSYEPAPAVRTYNYSRSYRSNTPSYALPRALRGY